MIEEEQQNLRYAQRLKDTHVYQHIEGLAKKIKKPKLYEQGKPIDADVQKRQIDVFYKVGWQYQHHHSSMACDVSQPIYMGCSFSLNEELNQYYNYMNQFIYRLKKEHEDESAFKIEMRNYLNIQQAEKEESQNLTCAKITYETIIDVLEIVLQKFLENFKSHEEQEIGQTYWDVHQIFMILQQWVHTLQNEIHYTRQRDMEDLEFTQTTVIAPILEFITNFMSVTDTVISQKRSALINYQPSISNLTYLVHPVLLGIYSFYRRQRILWQNQYEHDVSKIDFSDKGPKQKDMLPEDIKHLQISKVVFVNLDGYESEFNIELAKNMDKHLMYVSFPKFENDGSEEHMPLNNRFFKKMLYNYCLEIYEFDNTQFDVFEGFEFEDEDKLSEQCDQNIKHEFQLRYNPEKYFKTMAEVSATKMQKNQNIYILPMSFKYLQKEFLTLFKDSKDASKYASYFVWFFIRDFVGDDIKRFNPSYIVFSYSGKINIIDGHFIKIMQQLAGASNRKVIFYPNLTTCLFEEDENYDNKSNLQINFQEPNFDLMRKFSQFLKITSGTYNLDPAEDREPILSKYKTGKVNNYIIGLLKALSEHEYPQLKNRVSEIILKSSDIIFSNGIKECKQEISNSVPEYYKQLYENIKEALMTGNLEEGSKELEDLVFDIRQYLRQISENDKEANIDYLIDEIITNYYLETSSEKLSESIYVYIKNHPEKEQYESIQQPPVQIFDQNEGVNYNLPKTANNLNGLYNVTLRNDRKVLPIYKSSEIIYKTNQRHKSKINGKKYCNLMVMNHIENDKLPTSYSGCFQVSDKRSESPITRRIDVFPIIFNRPDEDSRFKLRVNWSYAETSTYYILYWPSEYNLLQVKFHAIEERKYQPILLNQIYVAQIPNSKPKSLIFNLANFDINNLYPRKNCSAYEMHDQDKLIIFGGFFDGEANYLNLQTNITGLDFQNYDHENRKCIVTNQKGTMYDLQPLMNENTMQDENSQNIVNNSYVRTRRDYEFYELDELCDLTQQQRDQEQQYKTVYMIGGYGENFLRPYSLISCNYYELKIDRGQRSLVSVKRKFVYNRVLTSNIKGFIKNKGSFQYFPVLENQVIKQKHLSPEHYVAHRSAYKLVKTERNDEPIRQLQVKTKYFFGLPIFTSFRKSFCGFANKIIENYDETTNESSEFFLSHSFQGNHYLLMIKGKNKVQLLRVQLEVSSENDEAPKIYGLSHESIISIDIKNKSVVALIKHEHYTNNKYVLAECELHDQNVNRVILKVIHTLDKDLSQYSIFSPRKGQVLLLHGTTFDQLKIPDYLLTFGRKDKQKILKKELICQKIQSNQAQKIQTFLMKYFVSQNQIQEVRTYSFLINSRILKEPIPFVMHRLKTDTHEATYNWCVEEEGMVYFEQQESNRPLVISEISQIRHYNIETLSLSADAEKGLQMLLISVKSQKSQFIGEFSSAIKIDEGQNIYKIMASKTRHNSTWNKSFRVDSHLKTMNRYQACGMLKQ